jgi:hypothetical protein
MFFSIFLYVCMTKFHMFYVRAFRHTTDINTTTQFVPNTPEPILVNTRNRCCDAWLQIVYTYRICITYP